MRKIIIHAAISFILFISPFHVNASVYRCMSLLERDQLLEDLDQLQHAIEKLPPLELDVPTLTQGLFEFWDGIYREHTLLQQALQLQEEAQQENFDEEAGEYRLHQWAKEVIQQSITLLNREEIALQERRKLEAYKYTIRTISHTMRMFSKKPKFQEKSSTKKGKNPSQQASHAATSEGEPESAESSAKEPPSKETKSSPKSSSQNSS